MLKNVGCSMFYGKVCTRRKRDVICYLNKKQRQLQKCEVIFTIAFSSGDVDETKILD